MKNIKILFTILMLHSAILLNAQNEKHDTIKGTGELTRIIPLQEVVVIGEIKHDPSMVVIMEDFGIKPVQPKNSGELFSDITGFSLIKRSNYAVEPSFRASQHEQLNVIYDGGIRATHACPNRMDPITTLVNPEEVTRLEIVKGPFTVRYGPTFGGMINMVTGTGTVMDGKIHGTVSAGLESNSNAKVSIVQLRGNYKKFVYSGTLGYRNYGNYKDGDGREIPSSFKNTGYSLKAGYHISNYQKLYLSFRQNFGRTIMHAGLPMDGAYDDSSIAGIDYRFITRGGSFKGITLKGYYSFVDHQMDNYQKISFASTEAVAGVTSRMIGGKVEGEWGLGERISLFTGIDYTDQFRSGSRERLIKKDMTGNPLPEPKKLTDEIWQDASLSQKGIFIEGKYSVSEKSVFTFGSRVDFVNSRADNPDASFEEIHSGLSGRSEVNFSGTISYSLQLNNYDRLELAFGRGVRTGNLEEKFICFSNIGSDAYEYVGNPYIKPEINHQFEIDYYGRIPHDGIISRFDYSGSVFYSRYGNYIMGIVDTTLIRKFNPTMPPVNPKVFQNVPDAFKYGAEVFGSIRFFNHFIFSAEMSYVFTERKDLKESLPLTPPLKAVFAFGYDREFLWAKVKYTVTSKQERVSSAFDESPTNGYSLVDIEAGVKPMKNLTIGTSVLNLTNKLYHNHLNFAFNNLSGFGKEFITEPGRNFTVFVSYKF